MFKDIRLSIDGKKIDYEYKINKSKIVINASKLEKGKTLKIIYDDNIYELKFKPKTVFNNGLSGEIIIELNSKTLSFNVGLKNNFYVKTVYKYINMLIDKKTLVDEITMFMNFKSRKSTNELIEKLLIDIDNGDKDLGELIVDYADEYMRIRELLVKDKVYLGFAKKMSAKELMLLITSFISVPCTPQIDQELFNALVIEAEKSDNSLENVWRLAMNYDKKGYNYDLLDSFFINSRSLWYLGEYISGVMQIDKDSLVNKIVETEDIEFIWKIVNDEFIVNHLEDKNKEYLKSLLKGD